MPKRACQDPDNAVPVRIEVVPRRGLSRQEAARYVGISTSTFDKLVHEGKMPPAFRIGSRTIWDLRKLDAAFDLLSGPEEEIDSFADWDPPPAKLGRQSWKEKVEAHASTVQARKDARLGSLARSKPSSDYPGHPNIYTADSLAERWTCSVGHVRNLIQQGRLHALERMGKLIRITPAAVIAFEKANVITPGK